MDAEEGEGKDDALRFRLPKGGYAPTFEHADVPIATEVVGSTKPRSPRWWIAGAACALLVLCILPVLASPRSSWAQGAAAAPVVTIRDAETEALIRAISEPLFRAAGVDPALVRITLIQNRAINAFVATGNRLFIHTGLIQQSDGPLELIGVLAHETGHISGGHLARLPEDRRSLQVIEDGCVPLDRMGEYIRVVRRVTSARDIAAS